MQPSPQAYWDPQRKEIQVVWGIGGRHRNFRVPPHPANLDVLSVEAINDNEAAIFYGRESGRPQWVQVVGIMSGGVHVSTNWQAYRDGLARRAQQEHSLVRLAQQQRHRSERQECDRQHQEAEARARERREQQRRALAARPTAEAPNCRATVPSRRDAQADLPARSEFIESRSAGGDYNEDELDDGGYYAEIPKQYATVYDVTPKTRRSNRTGWTWSGGLLAFVAGLIGLALSALAANHGPMPVADAFAGLSTLAVALFSVIGLVLPRIGGLGVMMFATIGAGLTGSADVRVWTAAAFAGGLMLWFGRRNRARRGTMRKLVRVTALAGVAALMMAEHLSTRHTAPRNTAATSRATGRQSRRARREVSMTTTKAIHRR